MTSNLVISIKEGKVKGIIKKNFDGGEFISFQGIPYAKSPLGNLRFKAPQPPEPWSGILDCTKEYEKQNKNLSTIACHEDYLILNVYSPKLPNEINSNPLPVMVWIHGGAFLTGSSATDLYGPDYLMTENVVLVTLNYRVGQLGFLNLEDENVNVPGNAGLKDMVMALKWVKTNIRNFGGDPSNITIFGESAGGAAVHYLMLSPMAKGLFHKAIIQSGSCLNPWARGIRNGYNFAKEMGSVSHSDKTILKHLQDVSIKDLYKFKHGPINVGNIQPFGPVVEKTIKEKTFLNKDPLEILESGQYNHVPLMVGTNSCEGLFLYTFLKHKPEKLWNNDNIVPYTLGLRKGSPLYNEVLQEIKQFYNINDSYSDDKIDNILKLITDNAFFIDIYNSAYKHLETSKAPLYFYRFNLQTNLNLIKQISGRPTSQGACHADDVCYLFKGDISPDILPNSEEELGMRRMVRLWTNFAKYGNPTPDSNDELLKIKWKPAQKNEFHYLEIAQKLLPKINPDQDVVNFWNQLIRKIKTRSKL